MGQFTTKDPSRRWQVWSMMLNFNLLVLSVTEKFFLFIFSYLLKILILNPLGLFLLYKSPLCIEQKNTCESFSKIELPVSKSSGVLIKNPDFWVQHRIRIFMFGAQDSSSTSSLGDSEPWNFI